MSHLRLYAVSFGCSLAKTIRYVAIYDHFGWARTASLALKWKWKLNWDRPLIFSLLLHQFQFNATSAVNNALHSSSTSTLNGMKMHTHHTSRHTTHTVRFFDDERVFDRTSNRRMPAQRRIQNKWTCSLRMSVSELLFIDRGRHTYNQHANHIGARGT